MERLAAISALRRWALASELLASAPEGARAAARATARLLVRTSDADWHAWRAAGFPSQWDAATRARLRAWDESHGRTALDALLLRIPPGVWELLRVPGLGPRRARELWRSGGLVTVQQVRRAARRDQLARLPGFGPRLQESLLAAIEADRRRQAHWLRAEALAAADRRESEFGATRGLLRLARAGGLRRGDETVAQLIWVAATDDPPTLLARWASQGGEIDPSGDGQEVRFEPEEGPPERWIAVTPERFAARLFLETGTRAHVAALLARLDPPLAGQETSASAPARRPAGGWLPATETQIYRRAGCRFVPPELREGNDELAAACADRLPELIEPDDLQGVFHVHTRWSDGRATIPELVAAARRLGWQYIGIADHSRAAFYARGLDADALARQAAEIAACQRENPDMRIFHGVECDILPDGRLDLDARTLSRLDYVIVSVHSLTWMDRAAMTARITRALAHPCALILAHPSGRLLLEREALDLDWEALFTAAARHGTLLEFNTTPARLDLDWRLMRAATARGIRFVINPDAHRLEMLEQVRPAVATARKGWLRAEQVLNTAGTEQVEAFLRERTCRS